ncbi:MAG: adenosylmethionine--8-amino-7-oxononanoate transaminase [Myxococcota bacterium]
MATTASPTATTAAVVSDTGSTSDLVARARRHVWHPFTAMASWGESDPILVIDRAQGNWLVSTDGERFLDGVSSLWCNVHGHRRAEIDQAVRTQLGRVAHTTLLGLTHAPAILLAEKLSALAPPGLSRVFYSDDGSTAVEAALKIAYQYWRDGGFPQKRRFVALENAYHGDTLGAVSVGGISAFHDAFRALIFDVLRAPVDGHAAALARIFAAHAGEIAALVVEPLVQGAAGMLLSPPGFLARAAALCREHDVLLIADEVATGFGRTGTMFACEQEGVTPDLLCLGKGITGGYLPLAATLVHERVFARFADGAAARRTFFHGHTYSGNPLACAAGVASLEIFAREGVIASLPATIDRLAARLREIARLPAVREVRQKGLMVGIDLGDAPPEQRLGFRVCLAARAHGVILRPLGNVIVWMPPLSIRESEIDLLAAATTAAIEETVPA